MAPDTYGRRQILRATTAAGALGLAGCSGDGGGTDGTTDGGGDTTGAGTTTGSAGGLGDPEGCTPGHTEGDPPCQQIADDLAVLARYDASGTPLRVDFGYPCGWRTSGTAQFEDRYQVNATRSGIGGGDPGTYVDVQVRSLYEPVTEDYLEEQTADGDFDRVDVEYAGETRTAAVSAKSTASFGTNAYLAVPQDGSLYAIELTSTQTGASCGEEAYEVVRAMVQSVEPNDERTAP